MNNKIKKLLASLLATTIFATTVRFTNINTTEKEQNSSTEITTITTDEEQTPEKENMIMPLLEPNYTHYVYNGDELRLDIGKALFGYHQTNEFYVYQGLQKTIGYCFQSDKSNPSEGSYPAIDINNIAPVWKRVVGRYIKFIIYNTHNQKHPTIY